MNPTNEDIKAAFTQIHHMIVNTREIVLMPNGGILISDSAIEWLNKNDLSEEDLVNYLHTESKNDIH